MSVVRSLNIWSCNGSRIPSRSYDAASSKAAERHRPRRLTTPRRGTMFVETAVGIALAVIVMIAVAQLVAVVAKQRREVAQSRLATQEVANLMERVMVLTWNELTTEAAMRFDVAEESAATLDDPQISITVSNSDNSLLTKKIEITLSWRDQATRRVEPVRLVAWKHQPAAAE